MGSGRGGETPKKIVLLGLQCFLVSFLSCQYSTFKASELEIYTSQIYLVSSHFLTLKCMTDLLCKVSVNYDVVSVLLNG